MTGEFQSFLFDTLVWTAALIALVLVLRRPVARYFGPHAAYALWFLPLARLVLPPIVLPAWLAPAEPLPAAETSQGSFTFIPAGPAEASSTLAAASAPIDWSLLVLGIWLLGAAVFLVVRFGFYFRMRDELLEDARPVGEAGRIRLVETPATKSPVAFGVFDKVVALPTGFMARSNRRERDLALEHEFAHHGAHDLLVNVMIQPLFALHWFNPLGWLGWRAMRRDQEAACDARVIASRGEGEKAAYASVIASFAASANAPRPISLAAPMACPVIGEKSIIHRLRSLTMSDISTRRRIAGRALIGAALVALPLTASVSYAESITTPNPPPAPVAPAAPAAPAIGGIAPPAPPVPPAPPSALALQAGPEAADDGKHVYVIREVEKDKNGKDVGRERKVIRHIEGDHELSKEEREEMIRELREELSEVDVEIEEAMKTYREVMIELQDEKGDMTRIEADCKAGGGAGEVTGKDGHKIVKLCTSEIMANALTGLKEARKAIASNPEMPSEMRAEVLKALDEKIKAWKAKS
ncbi:M56 family metallopeptidase [Pontixanthobacter luteolus]|uniref:M56 family metallopeptidase n=1 Tax=Pontixanthobacter luteolus TaxID=295089 RepID=UPI002304B34F|nr:M56 family metallopeptidase [Pontixanthobacter luteolus]